MTSGMRVALAESRDRLPLDRGQWNALAGGNAIRTAFQTWEWFDTWWAAFGGRHQLHFLGLLDGDRVAGFASLMRARGPCGLRQLEFTGTPNADYQDFVFPERRTDAMRALCGHLAESRHSWDMLVLRNVPGDSPSVAELRSECARHGLGFMDVERQSCPAFEIGGRPAAVQELLGRYSTRRVLKKLERHGPLTYRTITDDAELDRLLPEFFDQHVRRWQGTRYPSLFTDESFRRWYRHLAHAANRAGWLHFSRLCCGNAAAAFHFGFCYGDTLSWYKPSFEPAFARDSPGTALICRLAEDARARGLARLDFSAGREPFKSRFANNERQCVNLRVFSGRTLHGAFVTGAWLRGILRGLWHRMRGKQRAAGGGF